VPPNAFVDKNGQPVSGRVVLKYREFHNAADIIVSGIPMKMTDGGKEYDFESAGMFEINGYSGTAEVAIADGKDLVVQMASYKAEENYNHYYFDKEQGQWQELATAVKPEKIAATETPVANTTTAPIASELEAITATPIAPKKYDPNATVLNLNVDYRKYPYLKEFNGVVWQYAGTDPKNDPKNNVWLTKEKWGAVNLTLTDAAASIFTLTVTAGDKTYTAPVAPALSGKAFDKAMAKYKTSLAAYNTRQQQLTAAQQNAMASYQKHADIVRVFNVNSFGIYNCDRYRSDDGLYTLNWQVEMGDDQLNNIGTYIYHICKSDNTVTYCYPGSLQFKYDPAKENILLAVLSNDKVVIFDRADFAKLNTERPKNGSNYTFHFKDVAAPVSTPEDLTNLIAGI
jgi:hypothetical protein